MNDNNHPAREGTDAYHPAQHDAALTKIREDVLASVGDNAYNAGQCVYFGDGNLNDPVCILPDDEQLAGWLGDEYGHKSSADDQKKRAARITHRYNAHADLVAALKAYVDNYKLNKEDSKSDNPWLKLWKDIEANGVAALAKATATD